MAAEILKCLDTGSILEKLIGKRQSIIFALIFTALIFGHMGQTETSTVIVGFLGLLIKDYIDDVGVENKGI